MSDPHRGIKKLSTLESNFGAIRQFEIENEIGEKSGSVYQKPFQKSPDGARYTSPGRRPGFERAPPILEPWGDATRAGNVLRDRLFHAPSGCFFSASNIYCRYPNPCQNQYLFRNRNRYRYRYRIRSQKSIAIATAMPTEIPKNPKSLAHLKRRASDMHPEGMHYILLGSAVLAFRWTPFTARNSRLVRL